MKPSSRAGLFGVLLIVVVVLGGCSGRPPVAESLQPSYRSSFSISDPALDEESTAAGLERAPNVDLVGISATVGFDGLRTTFSYSDRWDPSSRSRWGIRFVVVGSDGTRLNGAWTQDPASPQLTPQVRLAPRPAGCLAQVRLRPVRRLVLTLTPGCLPGATASGARAWVRFDSLEAVTSWHRGGAILYGWDQLFARTVAPEPMRLYLPLAAGG